MTEPKEELRINLINMFCSELSPDKREEIGMRLAIILSKYNVTEATTEIIPYEGDVNEIMVKRFLAAKLAKGCSLRTIEYYKDTVTRNLAEIGKVYDQVTPDDVRLLIARRISIDKISPVTANNERRNLSSFYTWLQKEEILLKNPMAKVDTIKEKKVKKKAYSLLDIEKIRLACKTNRERAIVEFLSSTWCRVTEAAKVMISELNNDCVIVHGKGNKDRECYLNARAQLALQVYLSERKDNNPYLFPRAKEAGSLAAFTKTRKQKDACLWYMYPDAVDDQGRHMDASSLEGIVRNIGLRAGVEKCHPHRFRRTGATMALRAGMPLTEVSKLLGHENIETTQIYLDISDDELKQAHQKYVT